MITIGAPYTYRDEERGTMRLEAEIQNEKKNETYNIWFEVSEEYGPYLCSETADAFLLAVLPLAADSEQDICVHANLSPELYYNTLHTHIPFYAALLGKKEIRLQADRLEAVSFHGTAVATGCSMGVDSLSTIYQHIDADCPAEYRLTHLTLFNCCHFGYGDQETTDTAYRQSCRQATAFAEELGLKFLGVNSNVSELLYVSTLSVTQAFLYLTMSCALAVQKLVKKYLISSSYNSAHIGINREDMSHTEAVFVPQMGNNNTKAALSDVFADRTDKTARIAQYPLTPKYIDVCWSTYYDNMPDGDHYYASVKQHRNCGCCDKCLRTLFTMELLGHLADYEDAFDMSKYQYYRRDYIIKAVANAKYNVFYNEIYQLMKKTGFDIPKIAYVARFFNIKNSKLVLWLWRKYKAIKRKCAGKALADKAS